jgi:glycosyltransferase involved in cell wall biosynthesis
MAERKRIGIKFGVSYKKAAGVAIYFLNIVKVLKTLPDEKKPFLVIFYYPEAPIEDMQAIEYPYIEYAKISSYELPLNIFKRIFNKLYRLFFKRNFFLLQHYASLIKVDYLYDLYLSEENFLVDSQNHFCWIADFQQRYFPDNFSADEYKWHESTIMKIVEKQYPIILSSQNAKQDFDKFYFTHKNQVNVLSFVSILPELDINQWANIKSKYDIPDKYFIVSNQFWPHKNHLTIFKAIKYLKDRGNEVIIVCTGELYSHRGGSAYHNTLIDYIEHNSLQANIKFLGFLQREEQLLLIKHSICVIQPSLFEGWSTIVEDVKALNHSILLSNLRVHQEQITDKALFFEPFDFEQLSEKMLLFLTDSNRQIKIDYQKQIEIFSEKIIETFQ